MRAQEVHAKIQDFEPLMPIDVIRPPQIRDGVEMQFIPSPDTEEITESELEKIHQSEGEDRPNPEEQIPYKGDRNAPVDAEHPLANPPKKTE